MCMVKVTEKPDCLGELAVVHNRADMEACWVCSLKIVAFHQEVEHLTMVDVCLIHFLKLGQHLGVLAFQGLVEIPAGPTFLIHTVFLVEPVFLKSVEMLTYGSGT